MSRLYTLKLKRDKLQGSYSLCQQGTSRNMIEFQAYNKDSVHLIVETQCLKGLECDCRPLFSLSTTQTPFQDHQLAHHPFVLKYI